MSNPGTDLQASGNSDSTSSNSTSINTISNIHGMSGLNAMNGINTINGMNGNISALGNINTISGINTINTINGIGNISNINGINNIALGNINGNISTLSNINSTINSAINSAITNPSLSDSLNDTPPENDVDDSDEIAAAAEEAAQAVAEQDAISQQQQQLEQPIHRCRICGVGPQHNRPMLRFLPVEQDAATLVVAPTVVSFSEDISLHVFCGKTASILPTNNCPDMEILTKAGLKNKHGIGAEVNAALARTRYAILRQEGSKEKYFYLVREFEAHLRAIRNSRNNYFNDINTASMHINRTLLANNRLQLPMQSPAPVGVAQYPQLSDYRHLTLGFPSSVTPIVPTPLPPPPAVAAAPQYPVANRNDFTTTALNTYPTTTTTTAATTATATPDVKQIPTSAMAGQIHKAGGRRVMANGYTPAKVKCGCGGSYYPQTTAKGAASYRNHVATKRHQKWLESNNNNKGNEQQR